MAQRSNRRIGRRGVGRPNQSLGAQDPTILRTLGADRGGNYDFPIRVRAERGRAGVVELVHTGDVDEEVGLVVVRRFAMNVGDGSATVFDVPHGLGTMDLVGVVVYEVSSGDFYDVSALTVTAIGPSTLRIDFGGTTPTLNQYRVVVTG